MGLHDIDEQVAADLAEIIAAEQYLRITGTNRLNSDS